MTQHDKSSIPNENVIPDGYEWPGGEAIAGTTEPIFWISPDPKRSATPIYMVCGTEDHGLSIITGGCYLRWAIRIVDGLRATQSATADTTEKRFIRFVEVNEHEGETWNFWLELTGDNGSELEKLRERIRTEYTNPDGSLTESSLQEFTLTNDVEDESVVDVLVKYADDESGYMPADVKVTGVFTCPDDLGSHLDRLYKGGIQELFSTTETT